MSHMTGCVFLKSNLSFLDEIKDESIKNIFIKDKPGSGINVPAKYIYKVKEAVPIKHKIVNQSIIDAFKSRAQSVCKITPRCMYTLEPIGDAYPIGIPVTRKYQDGKVLFYCIDIFGSFNAVLAELRKRRESKVTGHLYNNSEKYLLELFDSYYPGEELIPFPDQRLLSIFNGPLSYGEFCESIKKFTGTKSRYICIPMAEEYSGTHI